LAVSCLAWQPAQLAEALEILKRHGVWALEATPGVFGGNLTLMNAELLRNRYEDILAAGLRIWSMQAILYGSAGVPALFSGGAAGRNDLFRALSSVIRQASVLGIKRLVFGSPKQRAKGALSFTEAYALAAAFFRQVGDAAAEHGCAVCLEPNAREYGSDWLETHEEAAELVALTNHPAILLQADVGALEMTGEDPAVLSGLVPLIGHAHLSRAALKPLGEQPPVSPWRAMAQAALEALFRGGYAGCVSLEMLGTDDAAGNMRRLDLALETGRKLLEPYDGA
jgi:sugar phosphate isomerase/epimerase